MADNLLSLARVPVPAAYKRSLSPPPGLGISGFNIVSWAFSLLLTSKFTLRPVRIRYSIRFNFFVFPYITLLAHVTLVRFYVY
ncbi:hypothetical protein GDO81_026040 [Engystomops pustulosus]|uniref:Uncharacterized protein n=1 Tax=Engystomops pustulosus TaxID=76066 RepID=A0AAV6Z3S2_ENGPU|nr:hypothetical protein GDO81_026040 [Engystomops pustulosus]